MIDSNDMKILDGYEHSFRTAVENNYCRNFGTSQYKELNDVYERITGYRYKADMSCPHCALEFIRRLGQLYFKEKERLAQEQPEPKDVTTSEPVKKPGRPKKQATNNK